MPAKNKLAKQLIEKHCLRNIPRPWNYVALRAIIEFSAFSKNQEQKKIKALKRELARQKRFYEDKIDDIKENMREQLWGRGY